MPAAIDGAPLRDNAYHLQKSLVWFEDAEAEPMPDVIRGIEWQSVRREIEDAVKAMWA